VATVEAVTIGQSLPSGASLPHIMTCASVAGNGDIIYTDYVVKLYADLPLGTPMLARELVGGLLGSILGFTVPAMAVVNVSADLVAQTDDPGLAAKIKRSAGYNFGSTLVPNPKIYQYIPDDYNQKAAEVFAFDMLIQNLDRNKRKPNMFQQHDRLILFDHEKAFLCARPEMLLGVIPEPWQFETLSPEQHVLYPALKGTDRSFDGFIKRLESVTAEILETIISRIPVPWHSDELGRIQRHVLSAVRNAGRFKRSLQEVLA